MKINIPNPFRRKPKVLGVAEARRYDLPLENDPGANFLRLLLGLMALLTILALAACFALEAMQDRWTSGLEGQFTVEVPAEQADKTDEAAALLNTHPAVESAEILSKDDIGALVSPWLGENWQEGDIPLPGIISVQLKDKADPDYAALERRLGSVAEGTRIDRHESWMDDVARFTGALTFAAVLITLIITTTVIIAVIGGVKNRMAINSEELELLHLMGATDGYITRQIMRHALILSLQGGFGGLALAALILMIVGWSAGQMGLTLLPDFSLDALHWALLVLCPVILAIMAMITARFTALRTLAMMP